jgi:hypothetical protein
MSTPAKPDDLDLLFSVERRMRDNLIEKAASEGLEPHEVDFSRSLEQGRTEILNVIFNSIDQNGLDGL